MGTLTDFSLPTFTIGIVTGISCGIILGWLARGKQRNGLYLSRKFFTEVEEESLTDYGSCNYKLILVVRSDLKMGKGKAAAQCSHASVLAYRQLQKLDPHTLQMWERCGQQKVVVKTDDEISLLQLLSEARKLHLPTSLVSDAGRTQIAAGSKTVLGIGPGPESLLDQVTGHLKLF